jgi:hypothetical protein
MHDWSRCLHDAAAEPPPPPAPEPSPGPEDWLASVTGRRIVVHITEPPETRSIEGLLVLVAPDGLVLRTAKLLDESRPLPLGGETWVPRNRVLFVQHVADAVPS